MSAQAAEFNPFEEGYLQDPPGYVKWAREQEPVFYSPELGYWVVTRYDDVKAVFREHGRFSPSNALEKITPPSPRVQEVLDSYRYAMNRTLVNEDEPAHMARRRLLLEPFTPEALRHHEPMVRRLAREYVDRFIDDGHANLVDQMLWEVPLTIALHFLGVDEEDMPLLRQYSIAHTINTWGRPDPEEQVRVAHAVGNFWQLAGRILEKMRKDPSGPGWMKFGLRMQQDHPDVVTDSYLHSMMMAGIVAAHETTANATANALRLLLEHPTAWRELCSDPTLIPNAVEECLRFSGSIIAWRRVALADVTVGGQALPAGSKLLLIMTSGNHDEGRFADADLLDIRRDNAGDHLSFGYGAHQCLGKNLARMELQIFLEELTRRLPHMTLAPQTFSYLPNTSFRGPEHLLVQWNPADNPERRDPARLQARQAVRIGESTRALVIRPLRVAARRVLAHDVIELRLEPLDAAPLPRWEPGAHIDIEIGAIAAEPGIDSGVNTGVNTGVNSDVNSEAEIGKPAVSRQYSLCGDPADRQAYTVAVLRDPQSRGGSQWLHEHAAVGDVLRTRGPRNHFRFEEAASGPVLFVAGGIGITPIAAMALRARALRRDYTLHYCGRSRASMAYIAELQALHGERLHLHIADEGTRADFTTLLQRGRSSAGLRVYACGPQRLLDALQDLCSAERGWPEETLRVEHFQVQPGTLDPSREQSFEVELRDSGLTLQVGADRTLLQALRAANIDVPSDCGEGLCGSCEVRVLAGAVDHRDVVLTRSERERNDRLMACCSRACGGERLVLEL